MFFWTRFNGAICRLIAKLWFSTLVFATEFARIGSSKFRRDCDTNPTISFFILAAADCVTDIAVTASTAGSDPV
jgi:hypothetical protein